MKWGAIMEKKYYELTAPQKSIWLTEQYYKNTNINNVCGTFYSDEILDFEILKKALNTFLQSNDSFRIKLHFTEDKVVQYFSDLENIDFKIIDIKNKNEQSTLEENMASKVFTMFDSLLFEIVLFRYPDNHGGFVINSHHLISDSWTNGIVANDVALIYSKIKNNESYEKDKSLSYIEYIDSEKKYIQSNKFQKDKEYWNNLFSTIPEVATIPSLKDSIKDDDITANRILLDIGTELFAKLKNYCSENKVSLYNFFMSVFALYLGRVSNLDEFVIGTPILNRTNYKEKETTGMFINTLPLKVTLSHEKTFLDNLKDIAVNSMSLLRHQKYSFQYLIEDLRKKDSNLPKLYNVLYSYQITKMNDNMDSLSHITSWAFNKTISDDLDIHMFEWNDNDSIQIAYDYRTSKYDEQDISDLHARILHVINQILENNNILLKDIEIVTPEEKHQILFDFNNTKSDYPKDKTIVDLFEEQVEKTPDNIAVVFEDQKLTYRELNEKANQLARYLLEKGVKKGDVVGVALPKSINLAISILSVLKCSATYMPIYVEYPTDRINYMIKDSKSKVIITISEFSSKFSNLDVVNLDKNHKITFFNTSNLHLSFFPTNNAYIIYTSGSTGKPKGVQVMHKNLINFVYAFKKYFNNIDYNDTFLSSTNIAFDVSIWEIFTPLLSGAKLVFNTTDIITDIIDFCNNIIKYNITALYIPPNILDDVYFILKTLDYKKINKLLVGVEPISNYSLNNFYKLNTNTIIVNGYGPTETTICASALLYKKDISSSHNVSIGKPLLNNQIFILYNGSLSPIGVPGEIYVSGDGVTHGYLNNALKTRESFIKLSQLNNTLAYKTGDIAKWNKDGTISFIGRKDSQIKLSGYRIELDEINNRVLGFNNIKKSKTIYNKDLNCIVCYFVADTVNLDISLLIEYLKKFLPIYMIPKFFKQLTEFPTNENGKLNYKLLPTDFNAPKQILDLPNSDIEKDLYSFINKNINGIPFGINTNLFEIGLDSLFAIKLSSYIYNKYNSSIPVAKIYENPTIKSISNIIYSLNTSISPCHTSSYYTISSAQKRVYYSWLRDKNSLLYNIAGGIIIEGNIDKSNLENCFKTLIKRHSSLRTYFEQKDDNIVQIIKDKVDFKLDYEISNTTDVDSIYRNFVKPFDLSEAPLFRTKLVKLDNKKSLLLLDMHHIISDGTSLNILLQELCDLYNGETLSTKELEYKDFTVWEQSQMNTDNFKKKKEYWVNQFKDEIPLLNMPTSYPRPSVQNFEGSNYHAKLSKEQFSKINLLAQKLGITPYILMLSVYYILLSKYTSQDDIVVGTPIVGRDMPELTNILGMFVNTLALRNSVDHSISFKNFSKQIKENCLNSFKNQTYPFDMLVNDLNVKRDTSRNPLFDVMFVFQNNGYPDIHINGMKSEYYIPDNNISKFDLTLEIVPVDNEYSLRFEYCTKLFEEDFIKRLSSHYINILNAILENEELKIADIDMLSEEEKNQILYKFNDTKVDYHKDKTIIDLFEEQVEKTPNNIAIVFEDKKLTYRELNEKANQLARFLLTNGTNTGDVISVLLPKSPKTIISMLAILKLGCSYLLIDMSLPSDRVKYMLQNSHTSLLISSTNVNDISFSNVLYINNISITPYSCDNLNIKSHINDNFVTLYTSGSTGTPKGISLHHQGFINLVLSHKILMNTDVCNVFLSFSSVSFDMFQVETWVPLLNGAKIILTSEDEQRNPIALLKLIEKENIDFILSTPLKISLIFECATHYLPSLKVIQLGGEKLSSSIISIIRRFSSANIYNAYGPSEITACCSCKKIVKNTNITIGRPICNMGILILDKDNKLLPIGVPGEIVIYGDGLSKGYVNNPNLSAKSFINLSWLNKRVYKSGDIGFYTSDGEIYYLNRLDGQIKLRGLRIELAEIEKVILEHPKVSNCHILVKNSEYLSAFITSSSTLDTREIREFLKSKLPLYMVPKYITQIKSMPINQNGKIDSKALQIYSENTITNSYVAPKTDTEFLFCFLWEELLHTKVGIEDDIFELGADSLLAIKFKTMLIKYNINISYSDIFKYPKIKNLCKKTKTIDVDDEISNYDYSKINTLLEKNVVNSSLSYETITHNNILLLGANGFVGMHIIDSFIKNDTGVIYCLIRDKNGISAESRFISTLHFYFGNALDKYIGTRIIILHGDILKTNFNLSSENLELLKNNVNIVLDSAATVKHYGKENDFINININSTKIAVDFCNNNNKEFIYISSLSVSGNDTLEGNINSLSTEYSFSEKDLFLGQKIENLYVKSKFISERYILENISNGLNAKIFRLGNITNRYSDGKFQINPNENAFATKLKSLIKLSCIPKSLIDSYVEFTPVDLCATAIISLIQNQASSLTVFHIYNYNHIYINDLISIFNRLNINISLVDNDKFEDILNFNLEHNPNILSAIINDLNGKELSYKSNVRITSDFTVSFLNLIGFNWPLIDEEYLKKYIKYFYDINFF